MEQSPEPTFEARIQAALPRLHPSERRLADVILGFRGQLASYSATELARIAEVSNATVTRFVRKVGFASFEAARQAARDDHLRDAALSRVHSGGARDPGGRAARHLAQAKRNLDHSFAALSDTALDELAQAMLTAPRVVVIGYRAAQPFARYLGWQVLQVLPNVTVLPRDGETVSEVLSGAQSNDCAVMIALRRAPPLVQTLQVEIAATGQKWALIGDTAMGTGPRPDWNFPCETMSDGPIFDHVAVMAVCNSIATRVIESSGKAGLDRMRRIEALHSTLDEL